MMDYGSAGLAPAMAIKAIVLASTVYGQGNTLTARWAIGHQNVPGNEHAKAHGKKRHSTNIQTRKAFLSHNESACLSQKGGV